MIKFKNTFFGHIENNELIIENMTDWSSRIHALEGEQIVLKLDKRKKPRSLEQNAYFHGVVCTLLADELGYTLEEIKGVLKWLFKIKHTSDLSTVEFEDLMTKIRMWASADLGVYIPSPNEPLTEFGL